MINLSDKLSGDSRVHFSVVLVITLEDLECLQTVAARGTEGGGDHEVNPDQSTDSEQEAA